MNKSRTYPANEAEMIKMRLEQGYNRRKGQVMDNGVIWQEITNKERFEKHIIEKAKEEWRNQKDGPHVRV